MIDDSSNEQRESDPGSDEEFIIEGLGSPDEIVEESIDERKKPVAAPETAAARSPGAAAKPVAKSKKVVRAKSESVTTWRSSSVRSLVVFGLSLSFLVSALVFFEADQPSPGPLAIVHGRIAKLAGGAGCVVCHGDAKRSLSDACLECHEVISEQILGTVGFHGQLEEANRRHCDICHVEHHGAGFDIIGKRSFLIAGYAEREDFDHSGLEFDLEGRHLELECQECHELADIPILPEGETRFLGVSGGCISCHQDPHEATLPNCADCHGQDHPFDQVANFSHDERFPLIGGHSRVTCAECHRDDSDASLANLRGKVLSGERANVEVRACGSCHDSSHRQNFVSGVADIMGVEEVRTCSLCHLPDRSAFVMDSSGMDPELHVASGFDLAEPHGELECTQCHEGLSSDEPAVAHLDFAELFPGRKADDCAQCHEDEHQGQFSQGPFADQDCISCHYPEGFQPTAFSLEQHTETSFPLTGSHVAVGCFECHDELAGEAGFRVFHGTASDCESCHEDVHEGAFDRLGSVDMQSQPAGCARCHQTDSFKNAMNSFEHGLWTDFELRGAHAAADCRSCHNGPAERAGGLGKASQNCADCHQDIHAGQFAVSGVTDCSRCHSDNDSFTETNFDHNRDSRFALDLQHAELDCQECHRPYALPGGGAMTRFKPLGIECRDCHLPERGRRLK